MRILHLTDFHYDGMAKHKNNESRLIDSLETALTAYNKKIDYVFFTGDLVWSGKNYNHFAEAKELLISRVCNVLDINETSFFVCPGNHDVYRDQELEDITDSIRNIENNDKLESYVTKKNKRSLEASLENLSNYYKFQKEFYAQHVIQFSDYEEDNMFTVHLRDSNDKKIGIVTINSAWRANDSKTDSGNLLFPLMYIKEASNRIKNCDLRILLLHHPLSDFKYWNQHALEDVIYKDFHLFFSGHIHSNRDTLHVTSDIGIYHSTAAATLSYEKDSIGFTILDVDEDSFELVIQNVIFNKPEEEFYFGNEKPTQIPVSKRKEEQNKFRKTIRKRFKERSDEANKLFLSYKELKEENNFIALFTDPIIKTFSQSNPKPKKTKNFSLIELREPKAKHQIIFGKDKSGKSAILYKVALDILHNFNKIKMLPILINCNNFLKSNSPIDIVELISSYYEINKTKATYLSKEFHIKILLDDFKEEEHYILSPLAKYLNSNKNSSVLAVGNETMFASFTGGLIGEIDFVNHYIHDITRLEIRLLTEKWPNIPLSKKEQVIEKIHEVFNQLNIPSNYWTVSLFIWIFEKNLDVNFGNNFQLIDLYIDSLLDRDNFILTKKYKIDFDDLKDFLADLAHHLVTEHSSTSYLIDYSQLIEYISLYKQSNKRFVIDTDEISDLILEKGILTKSVIGLYTFRLNGVFEYFLGHYMAFDQKFRNSVIKDGHFYLSFRNEFEICAGLIPQDYKFVKKVFKKTLQIFEPVIQQIDRNNIDALMLSKVADAFNITGEFRKVLKENLSESIPAEQQDIIIESLAPSDQRISEVKPKKYYSDIGTASDELENALYILGRVFRNSKLKNKDNFNNKVFDFILDSTCMLSLSLIEEITSQNIPDFKEDISEEKLIKLLTQFLPIVAQTFFFDMAIQANLETILLEKINELKTMKTGNELKLLILYFSLIDLDMKNNLKYIEEVIREIDIPILKQTTIFKLYLYLSFKTNSNRQLKKHLIEMIKLQELKIDSSQDKGLIEQRIEAVKKNTLKK